MKRPQQAGGRRMINSGSEFQTEQAEQASSERVEKDACKVMRCGSRPEQLKIEFMAQPRERVPIKLVDRC